MSPRIVINRRLAAVVLAPLLALLIALIGLAGTVPKAEAVPLTKGIPGFNEAGRDHLTGEPWWRTQTPSKAFKDAKQAAYTCFSQPALDENGKPVEHGDPIVAIGKKEAHDLERSGAWACYKA